MKRLFALGMVLAFALTGCGGKSGTEATETATTPTNSSATVSDTTSDETTNSIPFVGSWSCRENAEESVYSDYYVGYLGLRVEEDGVFDLVDAEAGNPELCGTIVYCDDMFITLACDDVDFDPPAMWDLEDVEFDLTYTLEGENVLKLTYDNNGSPATLIFDKR